MLPVMIEQFLRRLGSKGAMGGINLLPPVWWHLGATAPCGTPLAPNEVRPNGTHPNSPPSKMKAIIGSDAPFLYAFAVPGSQQT